MHVSINRLLSALGGLGLILSVPLSLKAASYAQTNLVSDIPGAAEQIDPNLKNPWGLAFSATSPFWVSSQQTNVATLYSGSGVPVALIVGVAGGPTGQVFNSAGAGNFALNNGSAASFVFDTLGGGIYGWNSGDNSSPSSGTAELKVSVAGASFTGLALAQNGQANLLYAANPAQGTINVFNSNFAAQTLGVNAFKDPNLPASYVPYNIQTINGLLYVEYENPGDRALGAGVVSVFNPNGTFVTELIGAGGALDTPWGVVIAPSGFGQFANDLLVGNFGNGEINAFEPLSGTNPGQFLGTLSNGNGTAIVDQDLWALAVRTGPGFDNNGIYFDAGINGQQDGLFGVIDPTPEPGSYGLAGLGCLAIAIRLSANHRKQKTKLASI